MATRSYTEAMDIAASLAEFDPGFLAALNRSLESWIAKNAKGPTSLGWMTLFCAKGYASVLQQILALLPRAKLEAFAAKLDKHHPQLVQYSSEDMIRHIVQLASGDIELSSKPNALPVNGKAKPKSNKRKAKMNLSEIVKISDSDLRFSELQRLTGGELKMGLEDLGMEAPSSLKKAQRIRFIEEELEAGWPKPRSVLDTSRY